MHTSNEPQFADLPTTPKPIICEFCGAERYTQGFDLLGRIMWCPSGAMPCTCEDGRADFERKQAEIKAKREAEEQQKADFEHRQRVQRNIGESGLGARFMRRTFDTFVGETQSDRRIKTMAVDYCENFEMMLPKRNQPLPERNGFFFFGSKGTGKTHISAAIANALLEKGKAVICMTERNIFDKIRKTYCEYGGDELAVRVTFERVPLLIIDDLGKEKPSEWTLSTLYAIVDGRYENALPTIVTTNYNFDELVKKLTPPKSDTTTAEAVLDRLQEMCQVIEMTGESWRSR